MGLLCVPAMCMEKHDGKTIGKLFVRVLAVLCKLCMYHPNLHISQAQHLMVRPVAGWAQRLHLLPVLLAVLMPVRYECLLFFDFQLFGFRLTLAADPTALHHTLRKRVVPSDSAL